MYSERTKTLILVFGKHTHNILDHPASRPPPPPLESAYAYEKGEEFEQRSGGIRAIYFFKCLLFPPSPGILEYQTDFGHADPKKKSTCAPPPPVQRSFQSWRDGSGKKGGQHVCAPPPPPHPFEMVPYAYAYAWESMITANKVHKFAEIHGNTR